jgi:localization factor PodJL
MLGIGDSQYNLAVLYARGIGVGQNLSEAYLWFALAAKGGDADAARKRDELAARLDPKMLAELRQKVDGWVAQQAPQEASTVPVPPGGWDKAEPAPAPKAKPTRHTHARAATTPI